MFPGHSTLVDTVAFSCKLLLCWFSLGKPEEKQITILRPPSINIMDVNYVPLLGYPQTRLEK